MTDIVEEHLSIFELENNISILFAAEVGSRQWGLECEDSDHDIIFFFVYNNISKYLSIDKPKDI